MKNGENKATVAYGDRTASRANMRPAEFITLSACTMMLTALGIDIMLPAFGALRTHFGLRPESTATAQIIVFFFMGQVAQLIFGILSDRFGRLPILRIGFPLYIIGGIAAAFAPSLELILLTALSSYVASSERITGDIYGRPELFAWIFAGIGLVMSFGTMVNARLSLRYGARRTIRWLLILYTVVGAFLLLFTIASGDPPSMLVFFIAVALLMAINLAVEPNSSALAMEPMGNMAGMASAVYGTFFFIGASLGSVISNLMIRGVFPIVCSFLIIGLISLLLVFSDRRPLNRH